MNSRLAASVSPEGGKRQYLPLSLAVICPICAGKCHCLCGTLSGSLAPAGSACHLTPLLRLHTSLREQMSFAQTYTQRTLCRTSQSLSFLQSVGLEREHSLELVLNLNKLTSRFCILFYFIALHFSFFYFIAFYTQYHVNS